jgi:hypothetical protein
LEEVRDEKESPECLDHNKRNSGQFIKKEDYTHDRVLKPENELTQNSRHSFEQRFLEHKRENRERDHIQRSRDNE